MSRSLSLPVPATISVGCWDRQGKQDLTYPSLTCSVKGTSKPVLCKGSLSPVACTGVVLKTFSSWQFILGMLIAGWKPTLVLSQTLSYFRFFRSAAANVLHWELVCLWNRRFRSCFSCRQVLQVINPCAKQSCAVQACDYLLEQYPNTPTRSQVQAFSTAVKVSLRCICSGQQRQFCVEHCNCTGYFSLWPAGLWT